ncbi:MAG: phosphoadenylyl-sulfate reductase [Acidobacteria bacterium]|nr:phosphoadenylyl-sulfate reductase [Acidobacteriota bacterium]MBV9626099.1 phosphoadenylyl-sulfate reductase [Acidobacteriota bacterium]
MTTELDEIIPVAETWSAGQVLDWALARYGEHVAIATGFGIEGMVLLDMAAKIKPGLKVFTGDTELLFPETYELMDRVEQKYNIRIERLYSDLTPEEQELKLGPSLWARDPDLCCSIRKVEPLRRKLASLRAWVTAIRRTQTPERAGVRKVDWDVKFSVVKISPLADWSRQMIWSYALSHGVPYNPLHDRNYPTIGCTHCTRAVKSGESPRAGRWPGFGKNECGLHSSAPPVPPAIRVSASGSED